MRLHTINSGLFKLDGGAMHGVVPKSLWQKYNPADENNLCSWAMRCLLIEYNNRLILIDTGLGDKQDEKFFGHYYLHGDYSLEKSLNEKGFGVDDITDVFLTHLHFDHCGGAINRVGDKLLPAFKNATYWSNEEHWNWAVYPNAREKASFLKENILPIQESGQLKFIPTQDNYEWMPGINIKFVDGHTEKQMLPLIHTGDKTLLYCADLLPSVAHIPAAWIMAYDMRPLLTLVEKEIVLKEAVENNWYLFFEHDYTHEICNLNKTEKGIRAGDTFDLNEVF